MGVYWTFVNEAKNLAEDQLDQPILKLPIIRDYREPLGQFLHPRTGLLDIEGNNHLLKEYLDSKLNF